MMIERLTGNNIPEIELRNNAFRRGAYGPALPQMSEVGGTDARGNVAMLNTIPGIQAELRNLSLEEMKAEIDKGNQVSVSHQWPGNGWHRVVVENIQLRPDGRSVITFDDPGMYDPADGRYGVQRSQSNTWWEQNGGSNTIVVSRK
jgi:hypothetical protein